MTNQYEIELSLAETESALVNTATSLVDHERRERFIGERIAYYRTLLQRRKDVIEQNLETTDSSNRSEDDNDEDLECSHLSPNSRKTQHDEWLAALRTRHMTDEANLQSVVELHKSIIAEIETLRRRVEDLTEKRDDIVKQMDECRDFIIDAAADW